MVLIVIIRERNLLLAIRRRIGVVAIKANGGGGLSVTGDAMIHQGARETREVCAVPLVFQTGARGGTCSGMRRIHGGPLPPECASGVPTEVLGVIGVRLPRGELIDTLGSEVPEGMRNRGLMSLSMESGSEALRQANLTIDAT